MARLVVSQNERLLLHLLDLDRYRDSAQVPFGLCQEGIAEALKTKVHNVSRALTPIEADGLVTDRLAHVQSAPRRRRVYSLTEKGRHTAESVKSRVEAKRVAWQEDGKTRQMSISDVIRQVSLTSGRIPSILEVVELARRDTPLTSSLFALQDGAAIDGQPMIERSHGRPVIGEFFGRTKEIKILTDALSNQGLSAIHVHGMPGIGKSTLLSKIFESTSGTRSQLWYTFREWDTERSFLDTLSDFLSELGSRNLGRSLRSGVATPDLFSTLVKDFKPTDLVLFLDDVHKVASRMELLLTMLIDAARIAGSSKVILISRTAFQFMPKDVRQCLSIEINELDSRSAEALVLNAGVEDPKGILKDSHGHPMLLSLMVSRGTGGGRRDVIDFVDSEVYSSLSAEERSAIELLSVFKHPVPVEALIGVDYSFISQLRRKSLVAEQDEGVWLHDLLRGYFVTRLGSDRKAEVHMAAGNYCESRPGAEWMLEALHHFVEAGSWDDASRVAIASGPELAMEFASETLELTSRIVQSGSDIPGFALLFRLRGELLEGMGRFDEALSDYEESLSLTPGDDEGRAGILESVARLRAINDELAKALDAHSEALSLYRQAKDTEGMVRELLSIGVIHKRRGSAEKARESYNEALIISTKSENRAAQAACLNNIGILDWEGGHPGEAETRFRDSLRLARAAKDHAGEARALENYAAYCRSYNRFDESANLLMESSEAHARAGDIMEAKRLRSLHAESMADQGRLDEAVKSCRAALSDPSLRKRKGFLQSSMVVDTGDAHLMLTLIDVLRISGDRESALQELDRYTQLTGQFDSHVLTARGCLERAMVFEDSADFEDALEALTEAEKLLSRAGDDEGLIAVHMRRGVIEEKRGNSSLAAQHYESAFRHADLSGNEKAKTIALDNLHAVTAE
jgi:tetratricopeptide (TPR) repeat protein/DNA-binding MarR family transcriptional regulator